MSGELELLPERLLAHLRLVLLALSMGALVSLPLGVWLAGRARARTWVLGAAGVVQTVPSLALLAIAVPLLAAIGGWTEAVFGASIPSIGVLPAVVALTLYSLLPMLRNTVAGIAGIDPAIVEAACGVGMTRKERLWLVELPLAAPVILAGVRTATVWVVGMATLATPVGATSLGNYIFAGLQTRNLDAILVGCLAAAALAILLDGVIALLEQGVARRDRRRVAFSTGALVAAALFALGSGRSREAFDAPIVRVGAKTFTESLILAEILAGSAARTGAETEILSSLGSTVAFDALRGGEIDAYVDYTGTIWTTVLGRSAGGSREDVLSGTAEALLEELEIEVVAALGFENAYALAMREADASARGIRTISDLTPHAPALEMGADYEFFDRPEWASLETAYALRFAARRSFDPSLMYEAAANGDVDVISAFSTDGRIEARNLRVLEDDRDAIPPYDAIVLVRPRLRQDRPRVVEAFERLAGSIDAAAMRAMNASVDGGGRSPKSVSEGFLGGR